MFAVPTVLHSPSIVAVFAWIMEFWYSRIRTSALMSDE
jgi:hypothetical protein